MRGGVSSPGLALRIDRKSTRLNSSHQLISYAVFCLKKKHGVAHLLGGEGPGVPRVLGEERLGYGDPHRAEESHLQSLRFFMHPEPPREFPDRAFAASEG